MSSQTKLVSKNMFFEQQEKIIKKLTTDKINEFYSKGKNRNKIFFADIVLWISFTFFMISTLIFAIFSGLIYFWPNLETNVHINNIKNSQWTWTIVFSSISAFTLLLLIICIRIRKNILKEIAKSFFAYDIYRYVFKYFGLHENFKRDEGVIVPKYEAINFYRNTKNFNDIPNGSVSLFGKYPIYDLKTEEHYIKMQNIEYFCSKWYDARLLDPKKLKKVKKRKTNTYLNQIENFEVKKRFGIAVKLANLKEDISLTMFDKKNIFTPENYENFQTQFDNLNIKTSNLHALEEWNKKENLEFLNTIFLELDNYKFKNKRQFIKNVSLMIRNREGFIWFDRNEEILDLNLKLKTLNKDKVIQQYIISMIDDLYLIYLILHLLLPFGFSLEINVVSSDQVIEEVFGKEYVEENSQEVISDVKMQKIEQVVQEQNQIGIDDRNELPFEKENIALERDEEIHVQIEQISNEQQNNEYFSPIVEDNK